MSLENTEIRNIAWLARLGMDAAELPRYREELGRILGLVEQMRSVDTSAIVPLAHPLEIPARLREDKVTEADRRERFQAIAPATGDGLYLVPQVIE